MAWTLCSKDDVLSIHPTNTNALKDFWSDAVEAMIRGHLGMPYLGRQVQVTGEKHDGGVNTIVLRRPPVLSVIGVYVDGMPVPQGWWFLDGNAIRTRSGIFPPGEGNIEVDYLSGSVTPEDIDPIIRLTAATMIVAILNYRGRMGADASLRFAVDSGTKEGEATPNVNIGLTSHLHAIMRRMLRRHTLRVAL